MPSQVVTYAGAKSRFYVSTGFESTAGTGVTLDKSFYAKSGGVTHGQKEKIVYNHTVTGFMGPIDRQRTEINSGGGLACKMSTDWMGWLFKMINSASPASDALVSPSTTVYEHTWNFQGNQNPNTFTMMKQIAGISTWTETHAGCQISDLSIKSNVGEIDADVTTIGFGLMTRGSAAPGQAVLSDGLTYLLGRNTNLYIDTVAMSPGLLMDDWSISMKLGLEQMQTGGSTVGAVTRIDNGKQIDFGAEITVINTSRADLDDFVNQTRHAYEFQCVGPIIDVANSINSLVAIKFPYGRIIEEYPSVIKNGTQTTKYKLGFDVDPATGYYAIMRVRNLETTY